jgi:hypothetical protein
MPFHCKKSVPEIACGDEGKRMSLAFFYLTAFTSMSVSSWLGRPWVARIISRLFIGTEKEGEERGLRGKIGLIFNFNSDSTG